jgi:hypothetical protein
MNYNTSRGEIVIPEYGRNIQLLIEHAKTIESKAERQVFIETIVDLMQRLHPQTRNVEDYIAKLWSHVFRIADYDLDVEPPCKILSREEVCKKPEQLPYPTNDVIYRHYGKNVQEMVRKASAMEDDDMQEEYVQVIGSYMKMAYKTWNRENVSDEMIRKNLVKISGGELELEEDTNIDGLINPKIRRRKISNASSTKTTRSNSRPNRSSSSSNRTTRSSNRSKTNIRRKKR